MSRVVICQIASLAIFFVVSAKNAFVYIYRTFSVYKQSIVVFLYALPDAFIFSAVISRFDSAKRFILAPLSFKSFGTHSLPLHHPAYPANTFLLFSALQERDAQNAKAPPPSEFCLMSMLKICVLCIIMQLHALSAEEIVLLFYISESRFSATFYLFSVICEL